MRDTVLKFEKPKLYVIIKYLCNNFVFLFQSCDGHVGLAPAAELLGWRGDGAPLRLGGRH